MGESALGVAYSNGRKSTAEYLETQDPNKKRGEMALEQQSVSDKDSAEDIVAKK